MSNQQPDIEIYVKTKDGDTIINWLESFFKQSLTLTKKGSLLTTQLQTPPHLIPVNIMLNAQSGFSSIWFDSAHTQWNNDLECATAFVKDTQIQARCIKSSWEEDESEDPDCWLQVENDSIKEILWK